MALRPKAPLPLPADVLAQLQDQLSPDYSSHLWLGDDKSILVARVPSESAPDLVNDLEGVVEAAAPADVQKADACVVLSGRQAHQVPMEPLKELMADRVTFDRHQCQMLRTQLPAAVAHTIYRAPEDTRRRLRLAVRIPAAHVGDIDDQMLAEVAEQIGPRLRQGEIQAAHCVYLIAERDDVRLDTGLFLKDVRARWEDAGRLRSIDLEIARNEDEKRTAASTGRRDFLGELESRYGGRPKVTPLAPRGSSWRGDVAAARARVDSMNDPDEQWVIEEIHEDGTRTVRDTTAPASAASHETPAHPSSTSPTPRIVAPPPRKEAAPGFDTGSKALEALAVRLSDAGYDVRVRPNVGEFKIDLAAEREGDYPQRVIALEEQRLTRDLADSTLAACKGFEVDLALVVCEAVDPEAERRIVATKVKVVRPDGIDRIDL